MRMEIRNPQDLAAHPEFQRLFIAPSREEIQKLGRQMASGSRFAPLLVDRKGQVLAGYEQWLAARELGWRRISVVQAPSMSLAETRALMVAENVKTTEIQEQHLYRGMNNFFDMESLRPPGGW